MCDDETNDIDALKHSHVGVALLSYPFDVTKAKAEKSQLPIGVPEVNWSILLGESYERLNSSVYCSTANDLAEKIVKIVKIKFKHLTSNAIPFSKLISYTHREINHQFRRSGKTPAAKFFGMTVYLKLYKKSLGLPESTNSTPIYFKNQVRTPNLDDSRLLLRCLCSIQGLHLLPRKRMLHVEEHIHDYIFVETAVQEEDVGYTSDSDEAAFSSQFEAVSGHDDGLLHQKNDDVANDELSLMNILEKELQSPETGTIAFIDESSYSGGGYGILLYHSNKSNENFAV
uniref:RT_RNaseH_2 domain-containing protein n=1 Tax=Strongyloides venezuelensis TaxID=75913 RepID=A0A0K0FRG4_STRVS